MNKNEDKKLINRIFAKLNGIPEFSSLSMDSRAEICIHVTRIIELESLDENAIQNDRDEILNSVNER